MYTSLKVPIALCDPHGGLLVWLSLLCLWAASNHTACISGPKRLFQGATEIPLLPWFQFALDIELPFYTVFLFVFKQSVTVIHCKGCTFLSVLC